MDKERDLGPQPIAQLLESHGIQARHLVEVSTDQLTHKMVARAIKGRRLTPNTMGKVLRALNLACSHEYGLTDLFNYCEKRPPDDPS